MLKFGTARNFSGQIGERALKAFVKDHAVKTAWRPDKFAEQCTIGECEAQQLDFIIRMFPFNLVSTGRMSPKIHLNSNRKENSPQALEE
jgi:hypothetical protein